MSLAREWTAFAGAAFALMGTGLAAAAARHAADALAWERQRRGEPPRDEDPRLASYASAYRAGGLVFAALGLILLAAAALGRSFALSGASRDALPGGLFFTGCGLFLAVNGLRRRRLSRAPRFLQDDPLACEAAPSGAERVSLFCTRALIALFLAFGIRLLREGLR